MHENRADDPLRSLASRVRQPIAFPAARPRTGRYGDRHEAGLDVELLHEKSPIFRFSSFDDFLAQGAHRRSVAIYNVLLTQLSTLGELVLLVPDQVAMILGRSKETLKEERDQGSPAAAR